MFLPKSLLLSDQLPRDHRAKVGLFLVVDSGDQKVGDLRSDFDLGPDRQVLRVRKDLALVGRILMKDIDGRPEHFLRLDRQVLFDFAERRQRGRVHINNLQFAIGHEHVGRSILQHRGQPRLLGLHDLPLADVFPVDDIAENSIACAVDAVDPGLQRDRAEGEFRLVRQCGRTAENLFDEPLVFVEAVDRCADDVVDFDVEGLADFALDSAQSLQGPLIRKNDREAGVRNKDVGLNAGEARLREFKRVQLAIDAGCGGRSASEFWVEYSWIKYLLLRFGNELHYLRQAHRPLRVENQQQSIGQLVGTANQLAGRPFERLGRTLEQLFRHFQHVADLVHQQADRAVIGVHDHVQGQLIGGPVAEVEATAEVDRRDDLPPQIDQPADHRRGEWHARHLLVADDFLHL